jgi:glycosyltransferase involved in cell wall biosynthesis
LEWLNRAVLRRAETVVALDQAMARRLTAKRSVASKIVVVPPWPEEDDVTPVSPEENPFRKEHGLEGKRVVMYSGTLGPSNPVTTLLAAAEQLEDDSRLVFLFVGGGTGMAEVRGRNRPNVRCLPYEPLARMRYSLSAGDVQVVSLGDEMAGIVHPCKVYGAMGIARPILFLGPPDSHVSEMMAQADFGWQVRHGDVAGAVAALREILAFDAEWLERKGARARALIQRNRTRRISCGRVCDAIEAARDVADARPGVPERGPRVTSLT